MLVPVEEKDAAEIIRPPTPPSTSRPGSRPPTTTGTSTAAAAATLSGLSIDIGPDKEIGLRSPYFRVGEGGRARVVDARRAKMLIKDFLVVR